MFEKIATIKKTIISVISLLLIVLGWFIYLVIIKYDFAKLLSNFYVWASIALFLLILSFAISNSIKERN